jgi:hypothetical protein
MEDMKATDMINKQFKFVDSSGNSFIGTVLDNDYTQFDIRVDKILQGNVISNYTEEPPAKEGDEIILLLGWQSNWKYYDESPLAAAGGARKRRSNKRRSNKRKSKRRSNKRRRRQ